MASPAAWVLCLFALVGCGEDEPSSPDQGPTAARATVLSGRVLDAEGGPVEGAEIFLAQEAVAWESTGAEPAEPLEMRRVLVGTTDASGRYAVSIPGSAAATRNVWLTAHHAAYPFCTSHDPWIIETGVSALPGPALRLLRAGALEGRIEDAEGVGLPEIEVVLRSPLVPTDFRVTSGLDGLFRYPAVPEGPVRVRLADGDDTELEADVVPAGEVSLPESLVADPAKGDG